MPSRGSAADWAPSRKISRGVMQHQSTPLLHMLGTRPGMTDRARGEHAWTGKHARQVLVERTGSQARTTGRNSVTPPVNVGGRGTHDVRIARNVFVVLSEGTTTRGLDP